MPLPSPAKPTDNAKWRHRYLKRAHEGVALPNAIHQTVRIAPETRVIVVGDIHGCFDELQELLQKTQYDAQADVLVFVGDLVNKGPNSLEVVRFAREHSILCVRGNHDDAALSAYYAWKRDSNGASLGKYDYVRGFSDEDVAYLECLPFTITLPNQQTIIVHAGLVPGVPLEEQNPLHMYKMRWLVRPRYEGDTSTSEWSATEAKPANENDTTEVKAWATQWPGPLHVIFGHDAVPGLQREPFATGLDTGCCYGRQLTACILPTHQIVFVDAHEVHSPVPQR